MNRKYFKILLLLLIVLGVATMSSCKKERYCRCTTTDMEVNEITIVNVDPSIKCKKLLSLGIETLYEGSLVRNVHPVTCEEVEPFDAYLEAHEE